MNRFLPPLAALTLAASVILPLSQPASASHLRVVRHAPTKSNTHKPPKPSPSPTPTSPSPSPTPTPTPTSSPTVFSPPASIPRDCSSDVTQALNTWFTQVPDGATADLGGGCFRSNGTIFLTNRHDLTVTNGAIRASTNAPNLTNRAQLSLNLGSNITLTNLTLEGSNLTPDCAQNPGGSCYDSNREWDHNLFIAGTDGVTASGVKFLHAWGDAVSASPGGNWDAQGNGALMARNVTVSNSSVNTTGRMAFACTGCKNFVITDNTITNIGYHVVDVEVEAPAWTGDVTLLRNSYSNVYLTLLSATTGSGEVKRGPFVVRDNVHTDAPVVCGGEVNVGASPFRTGAVTVMGNTLNSYLEGVNVTNADSATVTGNTIRAGNGGCGYNAGVAVINSGSATVTGNTVTNAQVAALIQNTPITQYCGNNLNGVPNQPSAC